MGQPGDNLACPRAMLPQACQHASCDLVPCRVASGGASLWSKRNHHPISPHQEGRCRQFGLQRLLGSKVSLGESLQLLVEWLQRPWAGCLSPTPYGPWADGAPAVPAQPPGRGRKRHQDGQGTSQGLDSPLVR